MEITINEHGFPSFRCEPDAPAAQMRLTIEDALALEQRALEEEDREYFSACLGIDSEGGGCTVRANEMSFPRYPEYKDSGVAWLGEVPAHWEIKPLKRVSTYNDDVLDEATDSDVELLYIDISNVNSINGIVAKETCTFGNAPSRARRRVKDGDILISTVRTYLRAIAKVQNAEPNLVVSTGFAVVRPQKELSSDFAGYALSANYFVEQVVARSSGISYPAINASELVGIAVAFPPKSEQAIINKFLDSEASKIDSLVVEQQRLIELLQEKRQAVIAHAVTKGLNPDAPMKPAGVEWLGEVPAHWELKPTKRLFKLVIEPAPENNDYELLSIYTDIGVRPRRELEERGNRASTTDGYWLVKKGDLIINKLLAWMGAIGVSNYEGVTSPAYDILRKTVPLDPNYYDFLFRCGICFAEFKRYSRGIMEMRLRLYFEELGQMMMPYPGESEQREIVMYLQKELTVIDSLVAEAEAAISLLQERRQALISAAVTGQIDVRRAVGV